MDKIYQAQVVNYGRRLILEFVVIEPAAFYRKARTNRHLPGVKAQLPSPPVFFDLEGLRALAARDAPGD